MKPRRYLILPVEGIRLGDTSMPSSLADAALRQLKPGSAMTALSRRLVRSAFPASGSEGAAAASAFVRPAGLNVVASLGETSVKLVEASIEMIAALRQQHPGIRVVEENFCYPAIAPRPILPPKAAVATAAALTVSPAPVVVEVLRADGSPVAGAEVYAFRTEAEGLKRKTNTAGRATFAFTSSATKLQRVFVYHDQPGAWGFFQTKVKAPQGLVQVKLAPIDLAADDAFRFFHAAASPTSGAGVRVGIIDSGIDTTHPDLTAAIEGGANCVPQSTRAVTDFGPSGPHGTHVAGIVAGGSTAPQGMRGAAPAAKLRIYRVFEDGNASSGSSFAVIDAIERAIADQCDIINLSLSFNPGVTDVAVSDALKKARNNGILAIAAAGNDSRQDVSFPASDGTCVAVSAAGRTGLFPATSTESAAVASPFGTDSANFLGGFSNMGGDIDLTGAGVGIISTIPGGHGAMSGTSMASPAIAGVAARLLGGRMDIFNLPRGAGRSDAIRKLLTDAAKPLGFGILFEGAGLVP